MSDDLDAIRALIPAYAGHAGADERRLSDQQVRAFAGELLVDLGDRLPAGDLQERFDRLLLRFEFGDQHVIKAVESDVLEAPEQVAAVEAQDRALIETAVRGRTVSAADLPAYLADLDAAMTHRALAIAALATKR